MSEIKVNSIKGVGASAAAITVNNTDGTCTANFTNRTNKNLIINGACLIAQRGVSSTSTAYQTVDRFRMITSGVDEAPTQAQADVASGTTPYTSGFRKCLKITNGNQTSGAGAADFIKIQYRLEAQDIANSGWNYLSASSYITLSFWVKSSVAQNFYGYLETSDGSAYLYPFETGSLSADTWTKITKTIPGNSNLTFNNDNGQGLQIEIHPFMGTDSTASGVALNTWAAYAAGTRTPDQTSTWFTTNDSTLEITGLQLEVGSVATDFEHRSFHDELMKCMRYYHRTGEGSSVGSNVVLAQGWSRNSTLAQLSVFFPVPMRIAPTAIETTGTAGDYRVSHGSTSGLCSAVPTFDGAGNRQANIYFTVSSGMTTGIGARGVTEGSGTKFIAFSAEL
tara:strand:+ start:1700 stop:2881 length:1182 start_codon:yes stop_codon:yes gene_type:complete